MKPLPSTIPDGWNADGWVQYLRTRAHSSDEHFPEVAAWFRAGADAVEKAQETHKTEKEPTLGEESVA